MDIMETLGKIGFDWHVALANLINFLIIFFILKKFAFAPIRRKLQERQDKINQGLEDAERSKTELLMAEEVYKKKIDEAKQNSNMIVAAAEDKSSEIIQNSREEARIQGEQLIARAKNIIQKEKEKNRAELKQEVVNVAFQVAEKILREKLDPKTNEELIKKLVDQKV